MFCSQCGKQIDDDSIFCPFCGRQVNAPVMNTKPFVEVIPVIPAKKGMSNVKKVFLGLGIGFVAVIGVLIGIIRLSIGFNYKMESVPEQLLAMELEDALNFYSGDLVTILDKEDIRYTAQGDAIVTLTPDPFLGGDCIFIYDDEPHFQFAVGFESNDDFNSFRQRLESYLEDNILDGIVPYKQESNMPYSINNVSYIYMEEKNAKGVDSYEERYSQIFADRYKGYILSNPYTEMMENDRDIGEIAVYKVISVDYVQQSFDYFSERFGVSLSDNNYINKCCIVSLNYAIASESMVEYELAFFGGYDWIRGEKIDIAAYKKSLDSQLIEQINTQVELKMNGDRIPLTKFDRVFYTAMYLMDNYNLKANSVSGPDDLVMPFYLSDAEKREWSMDELIGDSLHFARNGKWK